MAPHSSTLAWKIPWMEKPGRCSSDTTERLHFHFSLSCIGEGNGNLLQCFCLENPRDRGAWWAVVCGVAESNTTEVTEQQQQHEPVNAGDSKDMGLIPGLGRSSGGGHGNPLQYSCPENSTDLGAWWFIVHRPQKSWTQLK